MKIFKEKKVMILALLVVVFGLLAAGLGWNIIQQKKDHNSLTKSYNALNKDNTELKKKYDVAKQELLVLKDNTDVQTNPDSTIPQTEIKLPVISKNYTRYTYTDKQSEERILTLYNDNQATYLDYTGSIENGKMIGGGAGIWRGIYTTVGNKIIFIGSQDSDEPKQAPYTLKFDSQITAYSDILSFTKVNENTLIQDKTAVDQTSTTYTFTKK